MSSLKELVELGKQFGYDGESLRNFVREEQARERDLREKEREAKRELIELEKKAEREKLELEKKAEREKIELESEAVERQRAYEREKIELEKQAKKEKIELEKQAEREKVQLLTEFEDRKLEREKQARLETLEVEERNKDREYQRNSELLQTKREGERVFKLKGPKLPPFEDDKDNMDSYLNRFERYATVQKWEKDDWSLHLSSLLKGKALDVYFRLPVTDSLNYLALKEALLKRYELTEQGFRKKFKYSKPERGETFTQFVSRTCNYLQQWVECGKVVKTFEGLMDFLLRDQLLTTCGKELYLFLKERSFTSIYDMATQADLFAEARGGSQNVISRDGKNGNQARDQKPREPEKPSRTNQGKYKDKQCFTCKEWGHISPNCPKRKGPVQRVAVAIEGRGSINRKLDVSQPANREAAYEPIMRAGVGRDTIQSIGTCVFPEARVPTANGTVNGQEVTVLRDTGCTSVVVKRSLVRDDQLLGFKSPCMLLDQSIDNVPVARIEIVTPFLTGTVDALCIANPIYELTIGNVQGSRLPTMSDFRFPIIQAVQTRAQVKGDNKPLRKLKVPEAISDISRDEFLSEQERDETLHAIAEKILSGSVRKCKNGGSSRFLKRKGFMNREYATPDGRKYQQLVVPKKFRVHVLRVAHESSMAGHLGVKKTSDRVTREFYWPGVNSEVARFCRSCDVCQKTVPKGKITRIPLGQMPLIDTPFKRVAVDIIGPIFPHTERKNRYILTLVDYATRYPEAIALPSIETERVAEALVDMFSRIGVPEEVLTDCGAQFTSDLMAEISRLLSLKQLRTTPYHPMCNGLVEKFNGTLKQMLRRMCAERPKDWDRYLNAILFAYREVPHESLGFSPFEMLYGRTVRGPMRILRELWSGEVANEEVKTTYQYIIDLRERLESTCRIARDELAKSSHRHAKYYNRGTRSKKFNVGDQVLVLLPTNRNKLLVQWKGPYEVKHVKSEMDYVIDMEGKSKIFHANMLKLYIDRPSQTIDKGVLNVVCIAVIEDRSCDESELVSSTELPLEYPSDVGKEGVDQIRVCPDLSEGQRTQIMQVLSQYTDVFTDKPGRTGLIQHEIKLNTSEPI